MKVSPQMVRIVRRWPRTRARPRHRPRRTASAVTTGQGKAPRGNNPTRGLLPSAREATINYYDVLAQTDEEHGEVAAHLLSQGATVSPGLAQRPSAALQQNADPQTSGPAAGGAKTLRADARPYEPGNRIKVPSSTTSDPPAAGLAEAREPSHQGPPVRTVEEVPEEEAGGTGGNAAGSAGVNAAREDADKAGDGVTGEAESDTAVDAASDAAGSAAGDTRSGLDATAPPFAPAATGDRAAQPHEGKGEPPAQEGATAAQEGAAERAAEDRSGVSAPVDQGSDVRGSPRDPPPVPLSFTAPQRTSECGPREGEVLSRFPFRL